MVLKERFIVPLEPTFDLRQTLNCGQVFRFREDADKTVVFAASHMAEARIFNDFYEFVCDDAAFFQKYLDFDTNYGIIQLKTQDKGLVSSAIDHGKGIHILRQDAFETIISFIVSQNNHIPRIKAIIERLCNALGDDMGGYHAFPTAVQMAGADADFYQNLGAGYRAEYLRRAAVTLADVDLAEWNKLPTEELRSKLMALHGVGRKVADCALLFGFNRYDVFPVDTWILKVFEDQYPNVAADKLSKLLVERYGEYAGFVQQWLFFYKREEKNAAKEGK